MRFYVYRARNTAGSVVQGTIQAASTDHAHKLLEDDGLLPVEIKLAAEKAASVERRVFSGRIRDEDLIMFTRQLATLLNAGIPVLQSLNILKQQADAPVLKKALEAITRNIEGGTRISEALSEFPGIFSPQYVSIVVSGESGGDLVKSLSSIADWIEYEMEVKNEVKAAVRYPIMVIAALIGASALMVGFVIPRITMFLKIGNVPLALPTRMLLAGNDFVQRFWPLILGSIACLAVLAVVLYMIPSVRIRFDAGKFHWPLVGPLYTRMTIARLSHVLSMLVRNGIPVVKALEIVPGVVPNMFLRESMKKVRKNIQDGSSIVEGFSLMPIFPPIVLNLVAIGEKTGSLDVMLEHIVKQYNMEIRYKLKHLTSTIEPVITVILGLAVLYLALAILLPMWDMMQVVKR